MIIKVIAVEDVDPALVAGVLRAAGIYVHEVSVNEERFWHGTRYDDEED